MKKLIAVILIAAVAAGGYGFYLRPRPVVWKEELGIIPRPYCPWCDKAISLLAESACDKCGGKVVWEGKERIKQQIKDAGEAVEKDARDAGDAIKEELDKLKTK